MQAQHLRGELDIVNVGCLDENSLETRKDQHEILSRSWLPVGFDKRRLVHLHRELLGEHSGQAIFEPMMNHQTHSNQYDIRLDVPVHTAPFEAKFYTQLATVGRNFLPQKPIGQLPINDFGAIARVFGVHQFSTSVLNSQIQVRAPGSLLVCDLNVFS